MKLAFRALIVLLVTATLSVGAIAFLDAYFGRAITRKTIEQRQMDTAINLMDGLDRFVFERLNDTKVMAESALAFDVVTTDGSDPVLRAKLARELDNTISNSSGFVKFSVHDRGGKELASSDGNAPLVDFDASSDPETRATFAKALAGASVVSDVFRSEEIGRVTIEIMVPIKDGIGQVVGVVDGHVDYEMIFDILKAARTGDLYLVRNDGVLIGVNSSIRAGWVLREDLSTSSEYVNVRAAADGTSVGPSLGRIVGKVVTTKVREKGFASYPGQGWIMVLETPVGTAFAESDKLTIYSVVVAYLSGLIGILVMIVMMNRLVMIPIGKISVATKKIAAGDLEVRVPSDTRDELGDLAEAFNGMTAALKASYEKLEERVRNRTRELESRNLALEAAKRLAARHLADIESSRGAAVEANARLETLFTSMGDGVVVTDENGLLTYANRAAAELTGFEPKHVIGRSLSDLAQSVDLNGHPVIQTNRPLYRALHDGKSGSGKFVYKRRDGTVFPAAVVCNPIMNGRKIVGSITVFRDITDELASSRKIEEQEARYRALLSGIGDGVLAVDSRGSVFFVNQAVERLTGFKSTEIVGKQWADVLIATDETGKVVPFEERPIGVALTTGKISTHVLHFIKKDGSRLPVSATSSPVIVDGKVTNAIVVFRDITKERQVDKAKTEFISLASHELKSPIASIRWFLDFLLGGDAGKFNQTQKGYLTEIKRVNDRMNYLVTSLLDVSRIELGSLAIEPKMADLVKIAKAAADVQNVTIESKRIRFTKTFSKGLPKVMMDQKLMEIIIENLLSNALKYTPPKGKVSLALEQIGEEITITVTDSGLGIPKKQQTRIFERMFRAENAVNAKIEGTGLGLYMVKTILEDSGGRIWFESEEGKGSSFHVAIPIAGMKKKAGTRRLN